MTPPLVEVRDLVVRYAARGPSRGHPRRERRLVRRAQRGDALASSSASRDVARRRRGARSCDCSSRHPGASGSTARTSSRSRASRCAGCGATCRSSSRIHTRRSTPACRSGAAYAKLNDAHDTKGAQRPLTPASHSCWKKSAFRRETRRGGRTSSRVGSASASRSERAGWPPSRSSSCSTKLSSALDVTVQAQVLTLLAELQRARGLTLISSSRTILAVVQCAATRVAVMYLGRIVELGDGGAALRRSAPSVHEERSSRRSSVPDPRVQAGSHRVARRRELRWPCRGRRLPVLSALPAPCQRQCVPRRGALPLRDTGAGQVVAAYKGVGWLVALRRLPARRLLPTPHLQSAPMSLSRIRL